MATNAHVRDLDVGRPVVALCLLACLLHQPLASISLLPMPMSTLFSFRVLIFLKHIYLTDLDPSMSLTLIVGFLFLTPSNYAGLLPLLV